MMLYISFIATLATLAFIPAIHAVNFKTCLDEIRSGQWGPTGGTDNQGHPISNITNATAITYNLCVTACGSSSEPFQWSLFSQLFGSWLLPWLALISQLPYGTNNMLENLLSMLLTVGSPTLAAYSLALTVLNGRWIARRFSSFRVTNTRNAVKALSSLQQSPLTVTTDLHLLASLVFLPENEQWWSELVQWLDYTHTWSISAGTSVAWVVVAYVSTVVDSLQADIRISIAAHGQGIGSVWLWLLPIVTGWLQLSPKCDSVHLHRAMRHANARAYVATEFSEPVLVESLSPGEYAISLASSEYDSVRRDELCTAPIYNYARFLPWVQAVELLAGMFHAVSDHAHRRETHKSEDWAEEKTTPLQIADCYYRLQESAPRPSSRWGPGIWPRFILASVIALSLQWGTAGAAMLVNYYTPTYGIGCRTASYLLYATMSTLVWMLLVLSSFLSHYSTTTPCSFASARLARQLSIAFRIIGKVIAACNAVWIVLACLFQFSNFYDRCYCNSSVIGLGTKAYNVLEMFPDELRLTRVYWIIGVAVAAGNASLFVLFVNLFINPRLPGI